MNSYGPGPYNLENKIRYGVHARDIAAALMDLHETGTVAPILYKIGEEISVENRERERIAEECDNFGPVVELAHASVVAEYTSRIRRTRDKDKCNLSYCGFRGGYLVGDVPSCLRHVTYTALQSKSIIVDQVRTRTEAMIGPISDPTWKWLSHIINGVDFSAAARVAPWKK